MTHLNLDPLVPIVNIMRLNLILRYHGNRVSKCNQFYKFEKYHVRINFKCGVIFQEKKKKYANETVWAH